MWDSEVDIDYTVDYCEVHGPVEIIRWEPESEFAFDSIHYFNRYYWSCGCTYDGDWFRESFDL